MKSRIFSGVRFLFIALAIIYSYNISAVAQDITGAIVGTVRDVSGAVVAGATVTIADAQKNNAVVRTLTTNENGEFSAPNLQVSVYQITVEASNFKKSINTDIKLDVGQRRSVDVSLEAGNVTESVTVEADQVAVNLTTPTAGTTINGDQVRELSVNNRNFVQLVTLAPGVTNDLSDQVYVGTTNPSGQANTVNISVNGARSAQNTYTVDGSDITDRGSNITIQAYPSVDAIGEFKVLRSLYPAESGNSGGGQVNVVTRSGTDKFHGSLFEFVRNDKFNANDFLTNSSTNPPCGRESNGKARRCPLRYNNFGFTIGGPVYFFNFGEGKPEGLFRRYDKTFFFFSEEQRRARQYASFVTTVPDAALRNYTFPVDVCINLNNVTGATCTGANILPAGTPIPVALRSPTAAAYLNIYKTLPLPTGANYALNTSLVSGVNFQQEIVKIDHNFTDKWSAFYRYQRDKIPTSDANALFSSGAGLPGVSTTTSDSPGRAQTFQTTYVLTPKIIIEGRYNYSYGAILSRNIGLISTSVTSLPITLPFVNTRDRITSVSGNGFSTISGFGPYDNFSDKNGWAASMSMVRGSHTFKFGASYSMYRKNENALVTDTQGPNQGSFTSFSTTLPANVGTGTGQTLPAGISLATAQNLQRFANFLIGNAVAFRQAQFDYTADLRQKNIEAYAQDEWRFRPNLTLYYGIRYSRFGQPIDKNGRLSNFIPELYNAANAPQVNGAGNRVAGTGNFCNGLVVNSNNFQTADGCTPGISPYGEKIIKTPKLDFAPRVGLAWDPVGDGKTSVRLGYGIYHDQVLVGFAEQIIGANPPYQNNRDFSNVRLDNPAGTAGAGLPLAAATIRAIQADWKTPYMQHWSLDFQRQLGKRTVISMGYYGSKGTNLIGATEINEVAPGAAVNSLCAPNTLTYQTAGTAGLVRCQPVGYAYRVTTTATGGNPNCVGTTCTTDYLILDQIRPYRGYRSITMLQPRYNSVYYSFQFSGQHRFTSSSQLNVAYTFSKNFTDNQTDRSTAPQNTADTKAEYARATLDRRHVLTVNYVYELPFFNKQEGFAGKILGGWQTSGIITYQTGVPFSGATSNYDVAGLGFIPAAIAGGRPNALCDPNDGALNTAQQFFNTACFERNTATGVLVNNIPGTAGRGTIFGPKTFRTDVTLMKNIRFTESVRLQLRGEAFNILNTTNFRTIGTNVTLATYGTVTAVRDPRTLQFAVKLYF